MRRWSDGSGVRSALATSIGAAIAALAAGCGDSGTDSGLPSSVPLVTPSAGAPSPAATSASAADTVACSTVQASSADTLSGLGAVITSWDAHHQKDPEASDAYLPILHDGAHRYASVTCTHSGRVIDYSINYIPGLSRAQAASVLRAEVPADATTVYTKTTDSCIVTQFRSASLAHAFGGDDPGGIATGVMVLLDGPSTATIVTMHMDGHTASGSLPGSC